MARCSKWGVWCCVFFVTLRVITTELVHFNSTDFRKGPSPDFARHTIVKPRIYHGREKREISSTRDDGDGGHIHDLTIGYDVNGTDYVLDLQLNRALIPDRFFTRYQHGGRHVVNRPTGREVQLCQYQGRVRGREDSWAAISTCHGLSGMIFDGEEIHYLQPGSDEEHFLYKHSDITANQTCGYSGTPHHILENNEFNRILRYKRSSGVIRGPYNANRQSRYVELVLVVDHKEYKELGESVSKVNHHCKEIANIINALYQPLNIFVALVGVVVWTETDEISLSHNGDTTLTNFLHYRRERLVKDHPNDNAQLLTRWQFEGGVVGKALKGPICTFEFSGGVSMDHSSVVGLVATTVAHEMGHNLGMEHDTVECKCPTERCIMAPSSSSLSPTQWSSCSLDYLAVAFDHGMDYCLRNKPTSLFDSPVCGNGFVEAGEQCDCGLKDRCNNPCCNATSCMLFANASCATGECCDLKTCRPKNAGSECRTTYHECDLPEFCTGQGEYCPDDVFKMDGETCDRGKAFCYQGSCRTHTDQCKLLWGPSGKSSDTLCYQMNTNGTRHGNCGFNKFNRSYIKCNDENIYCGMLHCRHLNERLEFGMESVSILSHSFINSGGSIIPCRTAIVDLGVNEVDPGLAPDGAKCGDGKMCVNQKCMAVGSLRLQTGGCPMDCNGNGVCNSKGHCHCNVGFSPPHCDYPGTGGSQDSGPASDPNAQRDVMTALYIIFLGIVPLCALVAIFIYYTRHRAAAFWKKTSLSSSSSYVSQCCTTSFGKLKNMHGCCRKPNNSCFGGGCSCSRDSCSRDSCMKVTCGRFESKPSLRNLSKKLTKFAKVKDSENYKIVRKPANFLIRPTRNPPPVPSTSTEASSSTRVNQNQFSRVEITDRAGAVILSNASQKQKNRLSFNERLRKFGSLKKLHTGIVEVSVIDLPGMAVTNSNRREAPTPRKPQYISKPLTAARSIIAAKNKFLGGLHQSGNRYSNNTLHSKVTPHTSNSTSGNSQVEESVPTIRVENKNTVENTAASSSSDENHTSTLPDLPKLIQLQQQKNRLSFNERLKSLGSINKFNTGIVEVSVINLPCMEEQKVTPHIEISPPILQVDNVSRASAHTVNTSVRNGSNNFLVAPQNSEFLPSRRNKARVLPRVRNPKGLNLLMAENNEAEKKSSMTLSSSQQTPPVDSFLKFMNYDHQTRR